MGRNEKPVHLEQAEKEVTSEKALREITVAKRVIEVLYELYLTADIPVLGFQPKMSQESLDALRSGDLRRCPKCEIFWPLSKEFWHKDNSNSKGFHGLCKICQNKKNQTLKKLKS